MPPQGRLGDLAFVPADAHGCPACPHPAIGPGIAGSLDVLTNNLPSLRVGDPGMHAACCGPNTWNAKTGSATVLINGRRAHRQSDMTKHCGGVGQLTMGSPNVIVGDSTNVGGGAGAATQSSTVSPASPPPPAAPADPPPATPPDAPPSEKSKEPKQAPATWQLVYEDGAPVKGFRSQLSRASQKDEQELHPDGQGRNQLTAMDEDEAFSVVPVGLHKATGTVKDPDGKPLADVAIEVIRAYGPPVSAVTDSSGKFEAKGLLEDEPFEVVVRPRGTTAEGRFVDEKGKSVRVNTAAFLDRSRVVELPTRKDGTYKLEGRPHGDFYDLLFVGPELNAEGRFVNESGIPQSGVVARVRLSSGRTLDVVSDRDGRYRVPGVMPEESYSLEVLFRSGSK